MKTYTYNNITILVDNEDFNRVVGETLGLGGKKGDIVSIGYPTVPLGRFIMKYNGPLLVDHKDRNIFNNQKENLRIVTRSQNGANSKPRNRRRFKGTVKQSNGKWRTILMLNGKNIHGGYHNTEEGAARAYDRLAKKHFGEFAYLNFPEVPCQ